MKLIQQGAEAKIFLNEKDSLITKDRISKSYRIKELDEKIRKSRTRSETKLLEKAAEIINSPKPLQTFNIYQIKMPFLNGKKLSEHLNNFPIKEQKDICKEIGRTIAKLHNADIIHGDLTTSNMIWAPNSQVEQNPKLKRGDNSKVFFIDFGLGYISKKIEDRAVDLHLLKQALEAKHFEHWEDLFQSVEQGYKDYEESNNVLERLKAVEKRGRYKH